MSVIINATKYPCTPTLDGAALPAGTEIAAIDSLGNCIGAVKWKPGQANTIPVQGYDDKSPTIPGMLSGQKVHFRMWDSAHQVEKILVTYHFVAHSIPQVTADSLYSADGIACVDTLRGFTSPFAPTLLSPSNGAKNITTSLNLAWSSSATATTYGVQVSAVSDFSTTVFNGSGIAATSVAPTGIANNVTYYWRANATSPTGTGAWSIAWSFTTIVATPPAPVLSTPANGSANIAPAQTLSWAASAGATSYTAQVSQAANFSTTVLSQTQAGTSLAFTGTNGTTYYWRVLASNANPTASAWSSVWTFGIIPPVPATPSLTSPVNGATGVSTTAALAWSSVSYAASYTVQVSNSTSFGSTVFASTGSAVTASVPGLANSTTYYWRANASNAAGTSNWATVSSFTTSALGTPTLTTQIFTPNQTTTLSWSAVASATSYTVQASSSSDFATTIMQLAPATNSATYTFGNLRAVYWKVRAVSGASIGPWSTVGMMASTSVLVGPANGVKASFAVKSGRIAYSLPRSSQVEIAMYDMLGKTAYTMNRMQSAGSYVMEPRNCRLGAGKYVVRFKAAGIDRRVSMIVTR